MQYPLAQSLPIQVPTPIGKPADNIVITPRPVVSTNICGEISPFASPAKIVLTMNIARHANPLTEGKKTTKDAGDPCSFVAEIQQ
tara:strand:- start:30 stop:284 length:255 start_codon:yes stop_codon:yes gene_type:complete